jgi:hypothetical protein
MRMRCEQLKQNRRLNARAGLLREDPKQGGISVMRHQVKLIARSRDRAIARMCAAHKA